METGTDAENWHARRKPPAVLVSNRLRPGAFALFEVNMETGLTPHAGTQLALPGTVTPTSYTLPPDLPYEEWERVGGVLHQIEGAIQFWIGDWLNYGERTYGEKYAQAIQVATGLEYQALANHAWVAGKVEPSTRVETLSWSHHRLVAPLEPAEQAAWLNRAETEGLTYRELRKAIQTEQRRADGKLPERLPEGTFATLVVDPPWPMEKIERDVRPRQHGFDYATMAPEEMQAIAISEKAADDAHLYLWTTHKHLPLAFELVEAWGFKYECLMTWVKNVGFTPYSWMRSTEHVLFCRKGNLPLNRLGVRLDFDARVREHSRKPDEFYELVRQVSPEPRIDWFSRESRDGFVSYGDEATKFDTDV